MKIKIELQIDTVEDREEIEEFMGLIDRIKQFSTDHDIDWDEDEEYEEEIPEPAPKKNNRWRK
jgi:hypothetical protein